MHKLHIKDITKTIKKTQILHGISIEVKSGEIVGLLGPNGAGKTTTFYTVCGLVKPTSGTVYFDDKDITSLPLHKRALKGIGYLPQESSIFKDLSVEDNLMLAAEIVTKDKHYVGKGDKIIYNPKKEEYNIIGNGFVHEQKDDRKVYGDNILKKEKVELKGNKNYRVRTR